MRMVERDHYIQWVMCNPKKKNFKPMKLLDLVV
jgi:hypothetical protein